MGIFSRKPKVDCAVFCGNFYDSCVFPPNIGGNDPQLVYCQAVQKCIAEADPSFLAVDLDDLATNLLAIRMEVVGVAWFHRTKEKIAFAQSEFTKSYLADMGRDNLWELMGEYNTAVAQSTGYGADPNSRIGRVRITFINDMRMVIYESGAKSGRDREAVARVANRAGSGAPWKDSLTQRLLAARLATQLDYDATQETVFRMAAVAEGFYRGAAEELGKVKITL